MNGMMKQLTKPLVKMRWKMNIKIPKREMPDGSDFFLKTC